LCFATQETMMKRLGIGRAAFNKSLEYLIKRGWVSFTGMTGGKTRPIKTYKINNIWKLNTDFYEDKKIPAKTTLSKDTAVSDGDTVQNSSMIPAKTAVEEDPVLRRTKEEDRDVGLKEILNTFKVINPNYKTFFGNKTQRKATKELLATNSFKEIEKFVYLAKFSFNDQYFPNFISPFELQQKWPKVMKFWVTKQINDKRFITEFEKYWAEKTKNQDTGTIEAELGGRKFVYEVAK
jgi:hypothetical protein